MGNAAGKSQQEFTRKRHGSRHRRRSVRRSVRNSFTGKHRHRRSSRRASRTRRYRGGIGTPRTITVKTVTRNSLKKPKSLLRKVLVEQAKLAAEEGDEARKVVKALTTGSRGAFGPMKNDESEMSDEEVEAHLEMKRKEREKAKNKGSRK